MTKKMPTKVLNNLKSKSKPAKKHPMPAALKAHHDAKHGAGYKTNRKVQKGK